MDITETARKHEVSDEDMRHAESGTPEEQQAEAASMADGRADSGSPGPGAGSGLWLPSHILGREAVDGGLWLPPADGTEGADAMGREWWEPGRRHTGERFDEAMSPTDQSCRMCGDPDPLTVEHLPPKAVLLHEPRGSDHWNDAWDEDLPHEVAHRGEPWLGGYSVICRKCNNETGSMWASAYKEFCRLMMLAIAHCMPLAVAEVAQAPAGQIPDARREELFLPAVQPGAVLRLMLANAACLDPEGKLLAIPGMREFIQGDSAPEPLEDSVNIRLLAWAVPCALAAPVFEQHHASDQVSGAQYEMVAVAHMPVMFVVYLGPPSTGLLGVDITSWGSCPPRAKRHVLMKPPICVQPQQAGWWLI